MAWFNLKNILKKKKFGGVRDIINKDGEVYRCSSFIF